jgi:hypothetical protein
MLHPADDCSRSFLSASARAIGVRQIKGDPALFSYLLEEVAARHEETIRRDQRLEDFLDEAVGFALAHYRGRRLDRALLIVAVHTERLMRRLFREASWGSFIGADLIEPPPCTRLWCSRSHVELHSNGYPAFTSR